MPKRSTVTTTAGAARTTLTAMVDALTSEQVHALGDIATRVLARVSRSGA